MGIGSSNLKTSRGKFGQNTGWNSLPTLTVEAKLFCSSQKSRSFGENIDFLIFKVISARSQKTLSIRFLNFSLGTRSTAIDITVHGLTAVKKSDARSWYSTGFQIFGYLYISDLWRILMESKLASAACVHIQKLRSLSSSK